MITSLLLTEIDGTNSFPLYNIHRQKGNYKFFSLKPLLSASGKAAVKNKCDPVGGNTFDPDTAVSV
jgi:hypothetical protein